MCKVLLLFIFVIIQTVDLYSQVISNKDLSKLQDYLGNVPQINEFKDIISNKSSSIVLIYTISNSANETHYFYNSIAKPRKNKQDYKYGVTSGVIISEDGIVVTTYDGTINSDKYIVSIDSEQRTNNDSYGDITLTSKDYEAEIIRTIPELNLVFLQIKKNKGEKFKYCNIGNDSFLHSSGRNFLIHGSVIVGKCKGEYFVTESKPKNNSNKFNIYSVVIGRLYCKKIKGILKLVINTPITGEGVMPENHGGAILDLQGKLLGIATWDGGMNLPATFAIPASTIKRGIKLACPGILKYSSRSNLGINVEYLNKNQQRTLKQAINRSSKKFCIKLEEAIKNTYIDYKSQSLDSLIDNKCFGVVVKSVDINSDAYSDGIKTGDILLKFNDDCIIDPQTYDNLEDQSIGDQSIVLSVVREDKIEVIELRR